MIFVSGDCFDYSSFEKVSHVYVQPSIMNSRSYESWLLYNFQQYC